MIGREFHLDVGARRHGQSGGRLHGRPCADALAQGAGLSRGVVEGGPLRAIRRGRIHQTVIHGRVAKGQRAGRVERRIHNRVEPGQIRPSYLVAPLDEDVREVAFGLLVAELARRHDRTNQLVREGHHPPRRPERIVVLHLQVGGGGGPRLPGVGIEAVAFEAAHGVVRRHGNGLPGAARQAKGPEPARRGRAVEDVLPPFVPVVRAVGPHAEGGADILQVVADHAASSLGDERVQGVAGLHVREVRPRAEDTKGAEFAAVLMRHEIVRVVRARALIPEPAQDLAGQEAARGRAVRPVGTPVGAFEHLVDVVPGQGRPPARRALFRRGVGDGDLLRPQVRHEVLHLVVAEGPEELRRDHQRAGRAVRVRGRIEREEERLAVGILCGEPGGVSAALLARDGPAGRHRRRPDDGTAEHLVDGQLARADAVGEPTRVGHLVDGVHVLRAHVGRGPPGGHEQVVREVVEQVDVPRLRAGGVRRLRLPRDRVVGKELRLGGADAEGREEEAGGDEAPGDSAAPHRAVGDVMCHQALSRTRHRPRRRYGNLRCCGRGRRAAGWRTDRAGESRCRSRS